MSGGRCTCEDQRGFQDQGTGEFAPTTHQPRGGGRLGGPTLGGRSISILGSKNFPRFTPKREKHPPPRTLRGVGDGSIPPTPSPCATNLKNKRLVRDSSLDGAWRGTGWPGAGHRCQQPLSTTCQRVANAIGGPGRNGDGWMCKMGRVGYRAGTVEFSGKSPMVTRVGFAKKFLLFARLFLTPPMSLCLFVPEWVG